MIKGHYWDNRKERTLAFRYGSYVMTVRYMANCNVAQVTIEDISKFRLPLLWSRPMKDEQANGAIELFKSIGYFDMPL